MNNGGIKGLPLPPPLIQVSFSSLFNYIFPRLSSTGRFPLPRIDLPPIPLGILEDPRRILRILEGSGDPRMIPPEADLDHGGLDYCISPKPPHRLGYGIYSIP